MIAHALQSTQLLSCTAHSKQVSATIATVQQKNRCSDHRGTSLIKDCTPL